MRCHAFSCEHDNDRNNNNNNVKLDLQSSNMGNNITCIINCNYRVTAKIYTLETRFVSGT